MSKEDDFKKVLARQNQQIRQANHSKRYYISLFLLYFAIPLFVLSKLFYVYADAWTLFDLIFVIILLAIAIDGVYRESTSKTKLPFWFVVLGVISGIIVAILQVFL